MTLSTLPAPCPLIALVGHSRSGKTTLLETLIQQLSSRWRIAGIKHTHHDLPLDTPGKDSHRLQAAGANPMLLCTTSGWASFHQTPTPSLDTLVAQLPNALDLILVEGFKQAEIPHIWVTQSQPPATLSAHCIAIASLEPPTQQERPWLDLNQPRLIADFIEQYALPSQPAASTNKLMPVAEAEQAILDAITPVPDSETLPLADSLGRISAQTLHALQPNPPFDNAAMDGYALALSPEHRDYQVIGQSLAGHPYTGHCHPGQAVAITTGAMLPTGANSVVMQEEVTRHEQRLSIPANYPRDQHIRRRGEDSAVGDAVLNAGQAISAFHLAHLCSSGHAQVPVYRRPKVALLTTGDELAQAGQPLAPGQIYNSNQPMLCALLEQQGVDLIQQAIVSDDLDQICQQLQRLSQQVDMIISSGGVSVGVADKMKQALNQVGKMQLWRLAIKPGKPLAFGQIGSTQVMALPGNPVSAAVTYIRLVQPALNKLRGLSDYRPHFIHAHSRTTLSNHSQREAYLRGSLVYDSAQGWIVDELSQQGSADIAALSQANCLIQLPPGCGRLAPHTRVKVLPLTLGV